MSDLQRESVGNVVPLRPALRSPRAAPAPRRTLCAAAPVALPAKHRIDAALERAALERAMRDARDTVMPFRLFGEPAWELTIELFLRARDTAPLPVADLYNACSCDASMAAYHLGRLIAEGMVVASPAWESDAFATAVLSPRGLTLAVDIFNVDTPPR